VIKEKVIRPTNKRVHWRCRMLDTIPPLLACFRSTGKIIRGQGENKELKWRHSLIRMLRRAS